jgi:acyl phosphate:glycerol-3-phosphate acyltransferase
MFYFSCAYGIAFLLLILGYFFGSVPFGLIFSKILGHGDLRQYGSGNIGATNALRTGGKLLGFLTLFCDALKGVLAIYVSKYFCNDYILQMLVGSSAILGHVFPIWLGFRGGKGVATALAVIVVLNWHVGISMCIAWIITLVVTRISAVSALTAFVLSPIITYFLTYDFRLVIMNISIAVLIIIRHKSNIQKLLSELTHKN